jgi:multiple antibiotic resistance protein
MTDGLGLLGHTALLAIAALFPIVDPIAGAPIFLELTGSLDERRRAVLARVVAWNSFLLLLASMLVGAYVLDFFGLSIPAVQVAGGFVLAAMGWSLLNKAEPTDASERTTAGDAAADQGASQRLLSDKVQRRAFYPLTMPLTVGPGSISVAITLGANPRADVRTELLTATGHVLGALAVAASVYFCYRYAHTLVRVLGETGRTVVARLSAFLLLCIGVQIASNGILAMLAGVFR